MSLRSAEGITSFLDKERYTTYTVIIRGTEWNVKLPDGTTAPIDRNDFSFTLGNEHVKFDYAYITIHGTPGENGLLGSYFELIRMSSRVIDLAPSRCHHDRRCSEGRRSALLRETHMWRFQLRHH